jgi:superfamily II DNA/RNA helicase
MLARDGIPSDAIHGDKTQQERIKALDAFKEGKITALVATDVAARGLDIDQLPLVVNYELPPNAEDYVHRIGRTGRAGASGEALSLVDDKEERLLKDIEKLLKREFPRERAVFTPIAHASSSHRAARYSAPTHGKKTTPEEDWFMRPYEPSPVTAKVEEQPSVREDKPKKTVAALFRRPVEP